jgi:hypothetical protein
MVKEAPTLDTELEDLPPELRWREWMGRIEAVIFASASSVPRADLARRSGVRVKLKATWYDEDGKRTKGWARPVDMYLPAAIDREVDSFAKAAGRAPD